MSDIKTLQKRAMEICDRYDGLNKHNNQKKWDSQMYVNGFKKDVEDLIEILNHVETDREKLNHELSDCLWSVLVLARKLNVDIESAFWRTMGELDVRLDKELKA